MPRNQPIDWDLVYQAIDSHPTLSAAARALGLHFNTVWKATKRREGLCHRCFQHPAVPPSTHCDGCRAAMREYMKARRVRSKAQRVCLQCKTPLAASSDAFCEAHRLRNNELGIVQYARGKAIHGEAWLERIRGYNRRQKYGETANTVWNATGGACALCAAPYQKRRSHIHHIDGDHANGTESNLIVLCSHCHRLVHALLWHPQPGLVLAWVAQTYDLLTSRRPS